MVQQSSNTIRFHWFTLLCIKEYYVLLLVITVGLLVKFLWRAVFCKGKIKNNQIEFNLSIFAETILMFWYLAFVGAICFVFYTQSMAWYA